MENKESIKEEKTVENNREELAKKDAQIEEIKTDRDSKVESLTKVLESLKTLNGDNYSHNWDTYTDSRKFILADGVQVFIENHGFSSLCQGGDGDRCVRILVDINGVKGPNQWGRDVFEFSLKNNGLYPNGCGSVSCSGVSCTCKVLRENAMNY